MIVTLTANPSLDRTVALPGPLLRGEVQRAVSVTQESGGKGVNVSRALAASGLDDAGACCPARERPRPGRAAGAATCRSPPCPIDGAAAQQRGPHRARRGHHQDQRARTGARARTSRKP